MAGMIHRIEEYQWENENLVLIRDETQDVKPYPVRAWLRNRLKLSWVPQPPTVFIGVNREWRNGKVEKTKKMEVRDPNWP